jgi:hypothetical protein
MALVHAPNQAVQMVFAMTKHNKFLLLFVLLFFGCKDNNASKDSIEIIIPPQVNSVDLWNQVINSIEIKPLYPEIGFIGNYTKALIKDKNIYVYDLYQKKVFIFNEAGIAVNEITSGPAPHQPKEIRDFAFNERNQLVILSSWELLFFDLTGNFIKRERIDINQLTIANEYINPMQFTIIGDSYYFWTGTTGIESFKTPAYCLYRAGEDLKTSSRYIPTKIKNVEFYRFNSFGNQVYLAPPLANDTIYKIDHSGVHPEFILNFGEKSVASKMKTGNESLRILSENSCMGLRNIVVTDTYLYGVFNCDNENTHFLFEKSDQKIYTSKFETDSFPLVILGEYEGNLIGYIESENYPLLKQNMNFRRKLKNPEVLDSITRNHNTPLLILSLGK